MRPSRGMGCISKTSFKSGGIAKKNEPPKKPAPPRLDKALKQYKPRIPPTELM